MGKTLLLKLNNQFYNMDCVKEALEDFKDVCQSNILNDSIEIELIQTEEEHKFLVEEFSNYVLGLMKNKNLV